MITIHVQFIDGSTWSVKWLKEKEKEAKAMLACLARGEFITISGDDGTRIINGQHVTTASAIKEP